MKKTLTITASLAAFGFAQSAIAGEVMAPAAPAPAACESGLHGDLSLTYNSQFSYRGVNGILGDFADFFGADTDETYNAELNVSYNLNDQWALVGGANINTLSDTSVDHNRYRFGVSYSTDTYTVELGYQKQEISNVLSAVGFLPDLETEEIYLNAATTCPLTGGKLNLFIAHDIDQLDGTYAELSLNKGWELSQCVGLDVTVGVAYSFDYWDDLGGTGAIGTGSDWNHAYITVGLPWQAADNLIVTPFVTYSQGFGALDASAVISGLEEDDEVIFGVSASVSF